MAQADIVAAGGSANGVTGAVEYSVGLPVYEYQTGLFGSVSQGLQHPKSGIPRTIGLINGPSVVCEGEVHEYSIPLMTDAAGYQWMVPVGSVILSGQHSATILVRFGALPGFISVRPVNQYGYGYSATLFVQLMPERLYSVIHL